MNLSNTVSNLWLALAVIIIAVVSISVVSGKTCTSIQKRENIIHKEVRKPCQISYQDSCSWFSLSYCTFYKQGYCNQLSNETVTKYFQVTKCCEGYIRLQNGSCADERQIDPDLVEELRILQAAKEASTENPQYIIMGYSPKNGLHTDGKKEAQETRSKKIEAKDSGTLNLSHGTYAGIACAVLFLGVVITLTAIRVRKRQKRRLKQKSARDIEQAAQQIALHEPNTEQEAAAEETGGDTDQAQRIALNDITQPEETAPETGGDPIT